MSRPPRLAEAADLAVDDLVVQRRDDLVVEAEPLERARLEVGDDDVGALAQHAREREVRRALEVEHDRALVPVCGVVIGRTSLRVDGRHPMPRVVAVRRLDLDHIGAEVAERHRHKRSREDAREVDDEDPIERTRHGRDHSRPSGGRRGRRGSAPRGSTGSASPTGQARGRTAAQLGAGRSPGRAAGASPAPRR